MAITFNSGVTYEVIQTSSNFQDSVTAPALTEGLMTLVATSGNGSQNNRPDSATFNGDAFTRHATSTVALNGYSAGAIFSLVNPDAVTANVVVTLLASISGRKEFGVMFWEGVDQTTPVNASNGEQTTTGTSKTISVTTTVDNSWLVGGFKSDTNNLTAGSNTTFPTLANGGGNQLNSTRYAHSTGANTPTGSYSLNATLASTGDSGELLIAISPSGGGGGGSPTPLLMMMGVGS